MIRVVLPQHLMALARIDSEVGLTLDGPATTTAVLDALEEAYPMLCGTIREHQTLKRRPRVRFYADRQDISHDPPDTPLPEAVVSGREPFIVIGAISGG
jgi:hypothetical protein